MSREDEPVNHHCENARSLVPSYLDGELSEEQAGPLRNHLLACPSCREVAKEGKNLGRWFSKARAGAPVLVAPPGFAARVTQLAFAGVAPGAAVSPETAAETDRAPRLAPVRGTRSRPLLPFLLAFTAVAATALFFLALAVRQRALPPGGSIEAGTRVPWVQPDDSEVRPEPSLEEPDEEPEEASRDQ